jgi:hypothetical protein
VAHDHAEERKAPRRTLKQGKPRRRGIIFRVGKQVAYTSIFWLLQGIEERKLDKDKYGYYCGIPQ